MIEEKQDQEQEKECKICLLTKPKSLFYKNYKDCKKCRIKTVMTYYNYKKKQPLFSEEEVEEIKRMLDEGYFKYEIAEKLNRKTQQLNYFIRKKLKLYEPRDGSKIIY